MRLIELEPQMYRYESRVETWDTTSGPKTGSREYRIPVSSLAQAHCIQFLCPKCFEQANNTNYGVHVIEVSFAERGLAPEQGTHNKKGEPVRWSVSSLSDTDVDSISLSPSILLEDGCAWHGHITLGLITA